MTYREKALAQLARSETARVASVAAGKRDDGEAETALMDESAQTMVSAVVYALLAVADSIEATS